MLKPNSWIPDKTPYPREEGTARIKEKINTITQVVILENPVFSFTIDTTVSIREMEEVRAANNTRKKKAPPKKPDIFILANTFGRVINIRSAPELRADSSPPEKAKTEGMIIKPAKNAFAGQRAIY